jgi:hemerythrin-like domain-containing protein
MTKVEYLKSKDELKQIQESYKNDLQDLKNQISNEQKIISSLETYIDNMSSHIKLQNDFIDKILHVKNPIGDVQNESNK